MNQDVSRIIHNNYNCPLFKKQHKSTWQTLQDNICFECASNIPNSFIVIQAVMAIDVDFKTSCEADPKKIRDWISVFYPSRNFSSVFSQHIECSECEKEINGEIWFNPKHPKWIN